MAEPSEMLEENDATPTSRADAAGARHRSRGDVGDAGDADVAGAATPAVVSTSAAVDSSSDTSPRKSKTGSGAGLGKSG